MDLNETPFNMNGMTEYERLDLAVGLWRDNGRPPHHGQATEAILMAIAKHPGVLEDLLERERQIGQEGWTPEHDDEHVDGEMADAAACYAFNSSLLNSNDPPRNWPWRRESWKPCDRRRMLVKARALLLAEIERLERLDRARANDERDYGAGDCVPAN